MNVQEIAKYMKEEKGYEEIPMPDLIDVVRTGFESLTELAIKNPKDFHLVIPKVGAFRILLKPARVARNPKTGGTINVPTHYVLKFKTSSLVQKSLLEIKTPAETKTKKASKKAKK